MSPKNSARQLYSLLFTRDSMIERSAKLKESQYGIFARIQRLTHWLLDNLVILRILPLINRLHELLTVPVLLDRLEGLPDQVVVCPVQLLQVGVVLL